ncbi:Phr family secreted Rap phosphatase inhibitor [Flavicella sediminum]|uniref:Phr family secreted Rap phosphatase inhibitor n=1 Tax=Flavicella sediminum TaxID=2585141 RepID=UPI00111F5685|nr:Phr family secreted Rap phosphatase inhibitor [Flavicella sediminum]
MKKLKYLVLSLTLTLIISCGFKSSKQNDSVEFTQKTKVENVKINKDNKYAWAVTGMIRNNSSSNIKGAVKIKFLTPNGDIVHTTRAKVNDGDVLKPGQAGNFNYYTEPKNFNRVTDFDVEFYER